MFIDLLRSRRSVRKFIDRPVEPDKVDLLVEAALRAPSSRGFNPWSFVVVDDPETIRHLSTSKPHGASFLAHAPLAIAVCADPKKSDVWVEDVSIAAIILHLAATDLGLGSCWIQLRKRDHDAKKTASQFAAEVLGLPAGMTVSAIMAIGYPDQASTPHPHESLQQDKVSFNRYGKRP
ncbi:nitroreductase family protein [Desulfosarcina ovata]|uniref:Nitroreductase n=1 Tax=Desulfosarcina ovata subsp. ovata TaxID=2752305 RepID=A0A5K8AFI7_9BACT|nr:nitroreductase family protein [Desulfosarcina ovata]BBO91463.1 nitroreductase [Desulfosarcina ovata subsp. ovata]